MSFPNIEVVEPRHSTTQPKENGQRRVTEVTVSELIQLEQINGGQMGRPDASPKANEEMEVVVKLSDNMSVNLKCNANVTTVDLLTQLVSEIRDLTTQINSNSLEAKLTVPEEDNSDHINQQKDTLSDALTQISTVKELLVKKHVPTLKLELSPRSSPNNTSSGTAVSTANDSVGSSREVSRTSHESERSSIISLSPRPGSNDTQGATPRKKDTTPRPAEERPSLVAYMTAMLGDRAAISPEDKKILAKKFKRPTKRDKKANNSSSSLKKTPRTMRGTRNANGGGWVQTRPTGLPLQLNSNYNSGEFAPSSPSTEKKNATLRAKPPSPEDERHWTSTSPRSSTPPDEKIVTTRQSTQKSRTVTATPRLGNFLSVERQSLLSQSKVLKTDEKELAKEKLPTPIQKKHSIQVKLTCRLPENKVVEERFDIETAISDVKARIYELASKATMELETIDSYIFEFTDTKIFIFKENVTLKSLGIIDTQRSEYLTLALRSDALDVKNIVHKLNTILGGIVPGWDARDTEESDFRKKIARNSPSTVFSNVPLAQLTDAPLPFDFPKKIFIRFRLPDQTTKTLECDTQDSLQTVLRKVAELTARQTQRQIAINDHVIKLCGRAQFILEDVVVNKIEYVRSGIERRKRIEFHLVPLAQLFEWLHYRAKTNQGEFTRAAKRQVIRRVQTVESEDEEDEEEVLLNGKTSDEGLLLSTTVLGNTLHEDRASSDPTDATLESDLSPLNLSPRSNPAPTVEPDTEISALVSPSRPHSSRSARAARIVDPSTMKAAIKAQLSHERSRRTSYMAPRPSQDVTEQTDRDNSTASGNNTNVVKTPGYAPESNPARLTHTASKAQLNLPEILRCQDFSVPFSVRIVGISRLTLPDKFTRTLRSRETGVAWIEAVTVHRGEHLTQPTKTPIIQLNSDPQWQVDLAIGPALRRLPRETRLVLTLVGARTGVEGSQMILGWTALPLFDFRGVMVRGELTRYMRLDDSVSPIGPVSDSVDSKLKGTNKLELMFDDWGHDIYHVSPLPRIMNLDNYGKPSSHTIHQLQRILRTDTLWSPEPRDKQLLWHYRYAILKEIPQLLNKLLLCIDWTNRTVLEEMYSLLDIWPALDPLDALELLDAKFSDTKVREYAVKCLHKFSDEELKLYLLQLMQVLKYEPHHYSALAQFLLDRACRSEVTLGVAFFWYLHAEVDSEYRERFALIMEAFLMHCSERQREEIFKQLELMKKLREISIEIKEFPKDKRRDELVKRLKGSIVPRDFQLPLDPTIIVKRIDIEGCRVFDSAQAPLMLSLVLEDSCADPFPVIFKQGDDLRQDILTIQVLTIMDKLWKEKGLDLHLTRYAVLATSSDLGLIQVVTNAMTACKIQKAQGGALTGALKNSSLLAWIQEQNPNPQDFERAVDNFILSCAGYSVATYVLGVGDRHSDNIMVDRYGHFFHIDFGHFLGNFKYFGLLNRDKAPFAFPPEFAAVMGNKDSEKFKCFVEICCRAFNIVRANANMFLNLFAMMLSTGIAELRSEEDLLYLKGTMALHLNDDEAAELFRNLVYESLNTTATRINFLFHMWAH